METIIVYNPQTFNGRPSQPINDIFQNQKYELPVNTMLQFEVQTGRYLLKKYGFLRAVEPEEVPAIKKEMEDKPFKCEMCDAAFTTEQALHAHKLGKHKMSKENQAIIEGIPLAKPTGEVRARRMGQRQTPEQSAGVGEAGTKDSSGVEWVGNGLENDTSGTDMTVKIPGTKGVFGS